MNDSPSVLHVLAPMREGGLERVVTMMSVGQRANSVHVAAVVEPSTADRHPFIVQLEVLGVPVTRVVVGARSYLREYRSLSALVARLQPGVVHTHGYRALSREKSADMLLDALAQYDPSWRLSMLGEGPELDQLHQ